MARKKKEITCTMEFTEGAMQRITDAFVDLHYEIKNGLRKGLPTNSNDKPDETA